MSALFYHNPDVTHTYYLLIPQVGDYKVLLQNAGSHWALPQYEPQEHHFGVVHHINRHIWNAMSLHTATLRCLQTVYDIDKGEQRFYAMDNLDPNWQPPPESGWFSEEQIQTMPIADPLQAKMLRKWFDWLHSDNSLRVPWVRPGWFNEAADALVDMADRMDMSQFEAVEQIRTWSRSCTMRLKSSNGTLFMKAVPAMFNYEPVITRVLSIRYPDNAPEVRGVHIENGWMLMRDFKGKLLSEVHNIDIWERTIRRYAEVQIDLIRSTQSLIALGVPDRHVDFMVSQIPRLLRELPATLDAEEQAELKRLEPTLRTMAFDLLEYDIPLTLTHGDLWSGNITIDLNGEPIFFDWSDASVSHPYFDIPFFLSEIDAELPHNPDAHERLRDAYLKQWTQFATMSDLRQAYALAEVLGYLHQALVYHMLILPGIESNARWEMANMLPMLLRRVMAAVRTFEL